MMFIEAIQNINALVFDKDPKKKFEKSETDRVFDDGWMGMDVPPPPKNDSRQTLNELEEIKKIREMLTDTDKKIYINTDEDTNYYIKAYLDENDLEWSEEDMKKIIDGSRHVGRYFKNKFNRPRPFQLAKALGIDVGSEKFETVDSPSYPSNHALQARVVANYYGEKYPEHKKHLLKAADMSAEGRINAGVHFPSDKISAYIIADTLMEFLKDDVNEDAPVNATGAAVSTNVPIVKRKKMHTPNLVFGMLSRRK